MIKVIRITIVIISVILSILIYTNEYNVVIDKADIEHRIGKYLDKEIVVTKYEKVSNKYLVLFSFNDERTYDGVAILLNGINSKYRIGDISYSSDEGFKFADYLINGENHLVVYGNNIYEADGVLLKFRNSGSLKFELSEDDDILKIKKTNIKKASINLYNLNFKDKDNIVVRMKPLTTNSIDYRGEVKSGPESIVYVSSCLIILLGCIIQYSLKKNTKFYNYIEDKRMQNMILSNYNSNSYMGE